MYHDYFVAKHRYEIIDSLEHPTLYKAYFIHCQENKVTGLKRGCQMKL